MENTLFTACWDGYARAFDVRTGDELLSFAHPDGKFTVHLSPFWPPDAMLVAGVVALTVDSGMLFTAGWDGVARAWDASRGMQLLGFGEQQAANTEHRGRSLLLSAPVPPATPLSDRTSPR